VNKTLIIIKLHSSMYVEVSRRLAELRWRGRLNITGWNNSGSNGSGFFPLDWAMREI